MNTIKPEDLKIGTKVIWEGEVRTVDGIKIDRQYGILAVQFFEDIKARTAFGDPYIENRAWYST